ncbi:hypothetical protein KKA13_03360 [Patescibacteria group bacterium]|nr:hypothetical protein [Patescibacteria group bacterium]
MEEDLFPFPDSSFNQALIFNVFEHIYNYKFLTNEIFRVLGIGGQALGFVPFLVNVHPDPHDYFRYTEESLGKIFREAGFDQIDIKIIGRGPFAVHFNNIIFSIPKYLRPIFFIFYNFLDIIYIHLGHGVKERFPLGYFFNLQKK